MMPGLSGLAVAVRMPHPSLSDQNIIVSGAGAQGAGYTVRADGTVYDGSPSFLETWLNIGAASQYDVRATIQAGTTPSGTFNTWLNLGSDRNWAITDADADAAAETSTLLIELAYAGTGVPLDSAAIFLSANRTS